MLSFRDVTVVPFTELLGPIPRGAYHLGGPCWPDFDKQVHARHRHHNLTVDSEPNPEAATVTVHEPVAWAGPTVHHFGHQLADFSMRIVPTLAAWPEARLLFGRHPTKSFASWAFAPTWFRDLMTWLGVRGNRVGWALQPTLARELYVAPQAEQLGVGPSDAHLRLMDTLTRRGLVRSERSGNVFVSRAGTLRPFAGEAYLEDVMRQLGIRVVRPETMRIREQLSAYMSAEQLIFTEGSSVHGLQLLGRCIGDVLVLNRRQGNELARHSIEPRARSVRYIDVTEVTVMGTWDRGAPAPWLGISLLDEAKLLDAVATAGVDLRPVWDRHAFELDRHEAISRWYAQETASWRSDAPGWHEMVSKTLAEAGISLNR